MATISRYVLNPPDYMDLKYGAIFKKPTGCTAQLERAAPKIPNRNCTPPTEVIYMCNATLTLRQG